MVRHGGLFDSWKKAFILAKWTSSQIKMNVMIQDRAWLSEVGCYVKHGECAFLELFLRANIRWFSRYRPHIGRVNRSRSVPHGRWNFPLPVVYSQFLTIRSRCETITVYIADNDWQMLIPQITQVCNGPLHQLSLSITGESQALSTAKP